MKTVKRVAYVVPQIALLLGLALKPEFRNGLIALPQFGSTSGVIALLLMFQGAVLLSTPMLIGGFRDLEPWLFSWITTLSAFVICVYVFGIPRSLLALAGMLVGCMVASGIALKPFSPSRNQ